MKVFYTDVSKKSDKTKIGYALLKISVVLFILFIVIIIGSNLMFEMGTTEIKVSLYITMILVIIFFLTFIFGLIISKSKMTGEEDLRVFVYDNNNLYIIDKLGIVNDHFATSRLSMVGEAKELSILLTIENMLSYNKERKEKINESRNEEEIIESLKENKHNKIRDIEIVKDNGTTIVTIIRTEDGARKKIVIGNNYYNYEELFSIIRNFGGK